MIIAVDKGKQIASLTTKVHVSKFVLLMVSLALQVDDFLETIQIELPNKRVDVERFENVLFLAQIFDLKAFVMNDNRFSRLTPLDGFAATVVDNIPQFLRKFEETGIFHTQTGQIL